MFFLLLLNTIVYCSVESTITIAGSAKTSLEQNAIITNFSVYNANQNVTSSYEKFTKNTISSSVTFQGTASITYKIEITNYNINDVGIYAINSTGETIDYTLSNYTLKEKLCDDTGKCNKVSIKEILITISGTNCTKSFTLEFDIREFHKISYLNLTGNYPKEILDGDSIEINMSTDSPEAVIINADKTISYNYKNNILSLSNITCDIEIEAIKISNLQLVAKKDTLVMDKGSAVNVQVIKNNIQILGPNSTNLNLPVNYTVDRTIDINKQDSYTLTYYVGSDITKSPTTTARLLYTKPTSIDFNEFPYEMKNTKLNSLSNGYANISSINLDPQIKIEFDELNYYNPSDYPYIVVRYKSTSSQSNLMGIFTTSEPTDETYFTYISAIKTDGQWREVVFDLTKSEAIMNIDYVNGIRFDFTNNNNVTMDLDYIKFVKTLDVEYQVIEDFTDNSYSNFTYTNITSVSATNSILSFKTTGGDSQIKVTLPEDKYIDNKLHKFLYVRYKYSGSSSMMEFFLIPNPTDQTYSVSTSITGNNTWNIARFDLSSNSSIMALDKITGYRFDPMTISGVNMQIDYIAFSDRFR